MKKFVDIYLISLIALNFLMAMTLICAPYSATVLIESFLDNPRNESNATNETQNLNKEFKAIELLSGASSTIEKIQ